MVFLYHSTVESYARTCERQRSVSSGVETVHLTLGKVLAAVPQNLLIGVEWREEGILTEQALHQAGGLGWNGDCKSGAWLNEQRCRLSALQALSPKSQRRKQRARGGTKRKETTNCLPLLRVRPALNVSYRTCPRACLSKHAVALGKNTVQLTFFFLQSPCNRAT